MNVNRLADYSTKLVAIDGRNRLSKLLAQIPNKISEIIGNPQHAQFQTELLALVKELRAGLESAEKEITPPMHALLKELGSAFYFEASLAASIESQIHTNSITQAAVKKFVEDIVQRRNTFLEHLRGVSNHLKSIGLGPKELEPGDAEIGFKIPREIFDNLLGGFSEELAFIERVVELFSEAVTGSKEEAELSELSTTDPLVLLQLYAPIVAAIAETVAAFVVVYKESLEIRALKQQLLSHNITDTKQLDDRIEKIVDEKIEQRVGEVLAGRTDSGRQNEVGNGLRLVMKGLFARIERGMTVEVRFLPPPEKEDETEEEAAERAVYDDLARVQTQLVFPEIAAAPMLELTRSKPRAPKLPRKPRAKRTPKKS